MGENGGYCGFKIGGDKTETEAGLNFGVERVEEFFEFCRGFGDGVAGEDVACEGVEVDADANPGEPADALA